MMLGLGVLVGGCALVGRPEPREMEAIRGSFAYEGTSISPALVQLFSAFPTEVGPVVHAVDLTAAGVSPGFPAGVDDAGWITGEDGFAYRVVGRLDDGTHVLHTRGAGYEDEPTERVVFVVFEARYRADDTPRILMRCTGNNPIATGNTPVIVGDEVEVR